MFLDKESIYYAADILLFSYFHIVLRYIIHNLVNVLFSILVYIRQYLSHFRNI